MKYIVIKSLDCKCTHTYVLFGVKFVGNVLSNYQIPLHTHITVSFHKSAALVSGTLQKWTTTLYSRITWSSQVKQHDVTHKQYTNIMNKQMPYKKGSNIFELPTDVWK